MTTGCRHSQTVQRNSAHGCSRAYKCIRSTHSRPHLGNGPSDSRRTPECRCNLHARSRRPATVRADRPCLPSSVHFWRHRSMFGRFPCNALHHSDASHPFDFLWSIADAQWTCVHTALREQAPRSWFGRPSLSEHPINLTHDPVSSLHSSGDQRLGPRAGAAVKQIVGGFQVTCHEDSRHDCNALAPFVHRKRLSYSPFIRHKKMWTGELAGGVDTLLAQSPQISLQALCVCVDAAH